MWNLIETAPKDGSIILLTSTHPSWKYPFPAKWDGPKAGWIFADYPLNDVWGVSDLVTHWMRPPPVDLAIVSIANTALDYSDL